jgi:CheY-like chemotaxis protein
LKNNIIKLEVDESSNGEQAIDQYKKNKSENCKDEDCIQQYKLIIMDLGMPIKDGFMASEEILEI